MDNLLQDRPATTTFMGIIEKDRRVIRAYHTHRLADDCDLLIYCVGDFSRQRLSIRIGLG